MRFSNGALHCLALLASTKTAFGFAKTPFARSALLTTFSSRAFHATAMTSLSATAKMDQSFPTWRFDEPCKSAEWTDLPEVTMAVTADSAAVDDSDLVLIGVYGPEESDDSATEEAESPPIVLTGAAKEIDEKLGGALTEIAEENSKAFKAGGAPGATTPTLRVAGATVSPLSPKRGCPIDLASLGIDELLDLHDVFFFIECDCYSSGFVCVCVYVSVSVWASLSLQTCTSEYTPTHTNSLTHTHNAHNNTPVHADTEQKICARRTGQATQGGSRVCHRAQGRIDRGYQMQR